MGRLSIKKDVLRNLCLKSRNQCAFSNCNNLLITDNYVFIGQVCHIEAANVGGERFNPNQTDEERRSIDNLVLLCYEHHKVSDNVDEYTVKRLKEIKLNHENINVDDIGESTILKAIDKLKSNQDAIEQLLKNYLEQNIEEGNENVNGYKIISPSRDEVWLPEQNKLYHEDLPCGYYLDYMMRGDILCLTNGFPDGAEAYYEITESGSVKESRMPYPINEYTVEIPDDMLIRKEIYQLQNNDIREEYFLKYGRHILLTKDRFGKLVDASLQARFHVNHNKRLFRILGKNDT